jgi:uncharacterized oxidoreductase
MKLTGNTVFITGGGSGIGQAFAEEFHKRGNQVIITGRREENLKSVAKANPGMDYVVLNIQNPADILRAAKQVIAKYPAVNVLFNNAGIMLMDTVAGEVDEKLLTSTIETNLYGPIRLTAAFLEHFKQLPSATILNNSSALAFTPLASAAIYSATKAAIHSYTLSQRVALRKSNVRLQEIAPPWVATDLLPRAKEDPRAMPLTTFIEQTFKILETDAYEVAVPGAEPLLQGARLCGATQRDDGHVNRSWFRHPFRV